MGEKAQKEEEEGEDDGGSDAEAGCMELFYVLSTHHALSHLEDRQDRGFILMTLCRDLGPGSEWLGWVWDPGLVGCPLHCLVTAPRTGGVKVPLVV